MNIVMEKKKDEKDIKKRKNSKKKNSKKKSNKNNKINVIEGQMSLFDLVEENNA